MSEESRTSTVLSRKCIRVVNLTFSEFTIIAKVFHGISKCIFFLKTYLRESESYDPAVAGWNNWPGPRFMLP